MSAKMLGVLGIVAALIIAVIVVIFMGIGYRNKEVDLRNQAGAQQDANKIIYDKVWKVIKQKAQITDKYAADFKGIYTNIMGQRYQGDAKGAPMFKWIQEQNPNFSVEMYKDLADAIEANRAEFARVQMRLRDIKREHDNLRQKFPSSMFVGGRAELDIKLVTSTKTEKTFETGVDDDVDLFEKDKPKE